MPAQASSRLFLLGAVALLALTIATLIAADPAAAKAAKRSAGEAAVGHTEAASSRRKAKRAHKRGHHKPASGKRSAPVSVANATPIAVPATTPTPAPTPAPSAPTTPPPAPVASAPRVPGLLLEAGFETGNLMNWNIAGVGEVIPTVSTELARTGNDSGRFVLTGNQNRSELILGGNGGGDPAGQEEFFEGSEDWYGFSFYIRKMVYGKPGAHNLIMQFKSNGTGSPNFGLQLWDVNGKKGLWTGGAAQQVGKSGERFLAPVSENAWHDVQIHFKASEVGDGFYETFLDGQLVDAQTGVSMIVPGKGGAYIKNGLYRNGGTAPGTSEVFIDSAKLGTTQAAILP